MNHNNFNTISSLNTSSIEFYIRPFYQRARCNKYRRTRTVHTIRRHRTISVRVSNACQLRRRTLESRASKASKSKQCLRPVTEHSKLHRHRSAFISFVEEEGRSEPCSARAWVWRTCRCWGRRASWAWGSCGSAPAPPSPSPPPSPACRSSEVTDGKG